ncbi:MAG: hypothetical protein COV01_01065 [Candidatus Taylorbacteria bacterium CG10_big_fil_rev_8_21_14_0_10_41_48]|uniref:Bacterial Ig domain-containing protein n=1 Tax=Candidatus Taylorbacteria bacterium CG10_big_fil_rev_8_21_14_0_10_41_48 TaxID=1975024 RepID=A0A2M8LDB5_9BACT|nr:MAG: hypothetical protein COV01_01065 [Candidatus Taylorbacteria bacterium CG10_big_fil_rev_8_21_14_0_10_41_48]
MTDRLRTKRLLKIWIIILVAAGLLGYAAFQAEALYLGPRINIDSPTSGISTSTSLITISGSASNISYLSLNGEKIFTDEQGIFKESILLSYGYNIVTVSATDRFGRKVTKSLQLIYK